MNYFSLIVAIVILMLSLGAFAVNYFITKYPGNNYFPPDFLSISLMLGLLAYGTYLMCNTDSPYFKIVREFIYFFLVIVIIATATNAIQYTPFQPIDAQLIALDKALTIHLPTLVVWTANISWLHNSLTFCYNSLSYQMCYLPLLLIVTRKFTYIREYFALFLLTALLGFSFYYFFPTIGPASTFNGTSFTQNQYATGLKFTQIHHYIVPSTLDGGLIAMPSFHVIWAWLCLYSCRCFPIIFLLLFPFNLMLLASCVLLGWHYFTDLIGSLLILLIAHKIISYLSKIRT